MVVLSRARSNFSLMREQRVEQVYSITNFERDKDMLRDYQQRAIDDLHDYLEKYDGNPCLVLPTGSGKSHIVAEICRHSVQTWPETRIFDAYPRKRTNRAKRRQNA